MLLYHGSNIAVAEPKIIEPDRKLDFGTGFYLTSDYEQAMRWAELTAKRREAGSPTVTVFEYDEKALKKLNILKFEQADEKWLNFVSANRRNKPIKDDYDIVIGAVANDRTMPVISLFFAGVYDEAETVKRLLPQKLRDQYAFKTDKALSILHLKEVSGK